MAKNSLSQTKTFKNLQKPLICLILSVFIEFHCLALMPSFDKISMYLEN